MAAKETPTRKTIAVLGARGRIGSSITPALARAGYRVLLAGDGKNDPAPSVEKLSSWVAKLKLRMPKADVRFVSSSREASWEADVILCAVPYEVQTEVALKISDVVTGKIVVSMINPLNEACDGLVTAPTTSAAEELAHLLPNSKIVKAFNTVFPMHMEQPSIAGKTVDVFVAGDDKEAVSTVMQLVRDVGFTPIFVGELTMSRTLENIVVLLLSLSARNHFLGPVGWKVVHEKPDHAGQDNVD